MENIFHLVEALAVKVEPLFGWVGGDRREVIDYRIYPFIPILTYTYAVLEFR